MRLISRLLFVAPFLWVAAASCGHAQENSDRDFSPTPNLYGALGLNTVPSARMERPGTIRLSVGTADPYIHTVLGYQLNNRLYLGLRQSGQISSLRDDPDHVFPGLDFKLKLFEEKEFRPEIALGFQSAFGHKRMAGEYLTFSKRYENFDFTTGFGWGRFGTRNSVPNPLDWTDSYLNGNRNLDGEKPNSPKDWFKGDTGFFAGLEYATPVKGLSIKADWSSDSYQAEKNLGIDSPSAFSFGLSYQPNGFVDAGIAMMDKDTIMARVSLKSDIAKWAFKSSDKQDLIDPGLANHNDSVTAQGKVHKMTIRKVKTENGLISGQLYLKPYRSTPHQLSQAWRIMASKNADFLKIEPIYFGLKAPAITIRKHDLIDASENYHGSAEEIWRNTEFSDSSSKTARGIERYIPFFTLRENLSLSEDDSAMLHRTDFLTTLSHQLTANTLSETSLRYNLFSNLDRIENLRPLPYESVRSDESYYTKKRFAVERLFAQGFKSFSSNWHVMAGGGYLDEMFAGYHGEILYRPWGRNWAAGIEAANAIKRDYEAPLNMGYLGSSMVTAHVNFYYEVPDTETTIQASIGQYLGQDSGGTLSIKNSMASGASFEAFITATNMQDMDAYGGTSNISSGFKFSLPLGSIKHILNGSSLEINAIPIARDAGQKLNIAHPLYDMTEALSYRHLTQRWPEIAP